MFDGHKALPFFSKMGSAECHFCHGCGGLRDGCGSLTLRIEPPYS